MPALDINKLREIILSKQEKSKVTDRRDKSTSRSSRRTRLYSSSERSSSAEYCRSHSVSSDRGNRRKQSRSRQSRSRQSRSGRREENEKKKSRRREEETEKRKKTRYRNRSASRDHGRRRHRERSSLPSDDEMPKTKNSSEVRDALQNAFKNETTTHVSSSVAIKERKERLKRWRQQQRKYGKVSDISKETASGTKFVVLLSKDSSSANVQLSPERDRSKSSRPRKKEYSPDVHCYREGEWGKKRRSSRSLERKCKRRHRVSRSPRGELSELENHYSRRTKSSSRNSSPGKIKSTAPTGTVERDGEFNSDSELSSPIPTEMRFENWDLSTMGCRNVNKCYTHCNQISEGVYGVVHRAKDKETGELVALKKIKYWKSMSGFPVSSMREITLLMSLDHPNIIKFKEVVTNAKKSAIYMVMDYAENDIQYLMQVRKIRWTLPQSKCIFHQLLSAIGYLQSKWILHRDLKTSNLLLTKDGILKVCDLGMAREYGYPRKPFTNLVVTL